MRGPARAGWGRPGRGRELTRRGQDVKRCISFVSDNTTILPPAELAELIGLLLESVLAVGLAPDLFKVGRPARPRAPCCVPDAAWPHSTSFCG